MVITERWCEDLKSRGKGGFTILSDRRESSRFYGSNILHPSSGCKHKWLIKIGNDFQYHSTIKIGLIGCEISKDKWIHNESMIYGFSFRCAMPPIIHYPEHINNGKQIFNFSWNWHSKFIQFDDAIELQFYLNELSISVLTSSKRIIVDTISNDMKWKHCNLRLSTDCVYRLYTETETRCTLSLKHTQQWV